MKLNFSNAAITIEAADNNEPRITGIAVPYNVEAAVSTGQTVKLLAGSLPSDGRMPRLVLEHDTSRVVGVVDQRQDTPDGMLFSARIADTTEGRDLIALLKMGALDSVSVGIRATEYDYEGKTLLVKAAEWDELSVVYEGAFPTAQITKVAASTPEEETGENADEPQPQDNSGDNEMSEHIQEVEAAAETVPTQPLFASAKREFKMPSAGEWIAAQMQGGAVAAEFNARVRAAAPDVVTSDLDGIMPLPIVAPIYNNFRGLRPVIDAVGVRAMPTSGKVFIRPVVTTHTSMAAATENTAIQAGTFVVNDVQITKGIYGGYAEVSEASLDWSQPEVLSAMLDDMSRVYANTVDNVAADALEAGTTNTNNFTAADIAKPEVWVAWIYQAASDILSGSNGNLPTHLFMAPNRWASLGNLSDDSGRPLFPNVGPMNALGQLPAGDYAGNAFGLQVVVDRNLPSGTLIIGDATSGGFECWEQMKGAISIEQPSTLSRQIAFRGYFAAKMIDDTKFIKAAFV